MPPLKSFPAFRRGKTAFCRETHRFHRIIIDMDDNMVYFCIKNQ